MSFLFIVNPASGGGRGRAAWKTIEPMLGQADLPYSVCTTRGPGDARWAASRARTGGYEVVVVVGGDGTLHEVVNGLQAGQGLGLTLGIIPAGTGNDFARHLGIPRQPKRALPVVLNPRVRRLDVGRVNGELFINAAGVGLDACIAARVNKTAHKRPGQWTYLGALMAELPSFQNLELKLQVDDQVLSGRYLIVAVANGSSYGGGISIQPHASTSDGLLDVVVAGDVSKWQALKLLPAVWMGTHFRNDHVGSFRGERIIIRAQGPGMKYHLHADGEIGGSLPAEFEVVPAAIKVCCPQ